MIEETEVVSQRIFRKRRASAFPFARTARPERSSMQPKVAGISPVSEYDIHTPSSLARRLYLYPLYSGYYKYGPGYFITRASYDSFLLMYLTRGRCEIEADGQPLEARAGQLVLLDYYRPHRYGSRDAWEASWLHFDGPIARAYEQEITARHGRILTPSAGVPGLLYEIRSALRLPVSIGEAALSARLVHLLDLLLAGREAGQEEPGKDAAAEGIAYINEHFREPVSLELLAARAGMSPFHFLRIFSQAAGLTPHQYLISTRLCAARFLLRSTALSVKRIALDCGFSTEAAFCSTFRKWEGLTPSQYRKGADL